MKQLLLIPIILSTFILGFLVNSAFSYSTSIKELPFNSLFSRNSERESPSDYIQEENIQVFPDRIIIFLNNAKISSYEDTNSMDPLLDINHNGIEVPADCSNLEKGDIIAYKATWVNAIVIHRIVEISKNNEGIYFTAKGDNSNINDPQKIRCSEIKSKLVGVLY